VRRLAPDGLAAWQQVLDGDYEGYVAKDEASAYVGGPTKAWLKVKQPGWTLPKIAGSDGSRLRREPGGLQLQLAASKPSFERA
jgi:hypothetical protein